MTYFLKGMPEKAIEVLQEGVKIAAHPGWAEGMISMIRIRQGRRDEVRHIVDGMIAMRPRVNVSCMALGWAMAVLGDLDGAYRWVERAIEERDTLVGFVHIYTPLLAPELTSDPRYGALLDRLNFVRRCPVNPLALSSHAGSRRESSTRHRRHDTRHGKPHAEPVQKKRPVKTGLILGNCGRGERI